MKHLDKFAVAGSIHAFLGGGPQGLDLWWGGGEGGYWYRRFLKVTSELE